RRFGAGSHNSAVDAAGRESWPRRRPVGAWRRTKPFDTKWAPRRSRSDGRDGTSARGPFDARCALFRWARASVRLAHPDPLPARPSTVLGGQETLSAGALI